MTIRQLITPTDINVRIWLTVILILFAVMGRLMPHPANFAPIAAIAIFGGALLPRRWGLLLPLAAMVASDLVIGLHPTILFTWGSFIVIALASSYLMRRVTVINVVVASLSSSLFFYIVTNLGVWLEGRLYPLTMAGLEQSYINALPFLRNTVLGDLMFTGMLFGTYALALKYIVPMIATDLSLKNRDKLRT